MTPIELRLTGRQTTAAGIARALHPLLDRGPISRVELRLSTQTTPRVHEADIRKQLAQLLRDHGHALAAVSVRAHEGAIDDATGEHLLRVLPDERRAAPPPQSAWRRWLARRFPRWFAPAANGHAAAHARVEPDLHPRGAASALPPPDVKTVNETVKKLREAVVKAVAFVESPNGTELVGMPQAAQAIGQARITVRLASLDQVLGPLVSKDHNTIAQMVKSGGLTLGSGFRVDYRFEPPRNGVGTSYANESDIEVRLFLAGSASAAHDPAPTPAPTPAAVLHTLRPDAPAPQSTHPTQTALPAEPRPVVPALTVRVLGTMTGPFEQPFELRFDTLPARLDRQALQQAGFGREHAELLVVASNSCPLSFSTGKDGQVLLHAATWADTMGTQMPMYFNQRSLVGLYGERPLKAGGEVLVVNAPAGVRDPASGRLLPALVVELLPASARPGAAADPWLNHQRAA